MSEWIPVKFHKITDEERQENGYPEEWDIVFDCKMPDDGQEILVSTRWGVSQDTAYDDIDECYLENHDDWEDVDAWMPLPKPYREGDEK